GRALREILDERGALDPCTALRIASQIGEALEMLHHNGIIHGELGLESVLIVKDDDGTENPRLVGAELTAAHRTTIGLRLRDAVSLANLAPEQVELGQTTEATDVYALGRLLREMLTAKGMRDADGIRRQPTTIPLTINRIITTALDVRASERYPDISVMVNEIWGAHTELSEPKTRGRGVSPVPSSNERVRRLARSILGVGPAVVAAAIVVVVIAWAAMSDRISSHFRSAVPAPVQMSLPGDAGAASPAVNVSKPTPTLVPPAEVDQPNAPVTLPAVIETPSSASRPPVAGAPIAPEPARPPQPSLTSPRAPSTPRTQTTPLVRTERNIAADSRPPVDRPTTSDQRTPATTSRQESNVDSRGPTAVERRSAQPEQRPSVPTEQRGPAPVDQRSDPPVEGGDGSAIIDWLFKD